MDTEHSAVCANVGELELGELSGIKRTELYHEIAKQPVSRHYSSDSSEIAVMEFSVSAYLPSSIPK